MAVPHLDLSPEKRAHGDREPLEALRLRENCEVRGPQRLAGADEVPEQLPAPGIAQERLFLFGRRPRQQQILQLPSIVKGGDRAVAGPGERPGAVDHLPQDHVDVQVLADAKDRVGQPRHPGAQHVVLRPQTVTLAHPAPSLARQTLSRSRAPVSLEG